jgi:hypothetical protein
LTSRFLKLGVNFTLQTRERSDTAHGDYMEQLEPCPNFFTDELVE